MSRTQLPLSFEYILMGLLARRPMHGYDLYKEIHTLEAIHMIWEVKQSRLYALLDQLERSGCLCSDVISGDGLYPPRREYRLTEAGRQALESWVGSPVQHARDMRQDFLARLYFAANDGPAQAARLIEKQSFACQGWLEDLSSQTQCLAADSGYEKLIYSFRVRQVQSILAWLEECKKEFVS